MAEPTAALSVLVNALHAKSGGGITYLRNVLPGLAADPGLRVQLLLHAGQRALFEPLPAGVGLVCVDFRDGFMRRLVWEQVRLPSLARRLGARVTYSPANFGPLFAPAPVVLLRNALAVSASEPRLSKKGYWAALAAVTWASLVFCRRAIAVSDYARRALGRGLPRRVRERITVIPHGVGRPFGPPAPAETREGFVLAVADLYIQKNLHGLVAAIDRLRGQHPDVRLKIAGAPVDRDYSRRIEADVAARGLDRHVEFLGHLPPAELAGLYRRCGVFVFPSFVETFGNPLLEAMASGAAIASSNAAAMREVADDAALFFDPQDVAGMAETLARLLGDPGLRRALGEKAAARARAFSWEETARRTAAVLKSCVPAA